MNGNSHGVNTTKAIDSECKCDNLIICLEVKQNYAAFALLTATSTSSGNASKKLGPLGFHPSAFALSEFALLFEPQRYSDRPGSSGVIFPTRFASHETGLLSFGNQPCSTPNLLIAVAASIHLTSEETAK
jgi:hypothetical protein